MCFEGIKEGDVISFTVDHDQAHDKRIVVNKGLVIGISKECLRVIATTPISPHVHRTFTIEKERVKNVRVLIHSEDVLARCGHQLFKRGDTLTVNGAEELRGSLLGVLNDVAIVKCQNGRYVGAGLGLWIKN